MYHAMPRREPDLSVYDANRACLPFVQEAMAKDPAPYHAGPIAFPDGDEHPRRPSTANRNKFVLVGLNGEEILRVAQVPFEVRRQLIQVFGNPGECPPIDGEDGILGSIT